MFLRTDEHAGIGVRGAGIGPHGLAGIIVAGAEER